MHNKPDTFVILDQASGYLQLDILEAARSVYPNRVIIAGTVVERSVKLNASIVWHRVTPYDRSSIKHRTWSWLKTSWQMFWIVLWKYRKGHILAITNPPLTPFIPWVLGCRFDILVYDVYPDALVSYNYLSERNLIVRTWRWLNRKAFSKARKVYTLSESMKLLVSRYVSSEKIQIVPIWTDNKFIQPVPKEENQFLSDKDYKEKFIISYAGNMGQTHPVEILLEVAELLDPNLFHFVLAGGGYKYDLIKEKLQLKSIPNVSLYSWQPVEILPHVLSAASLSVVTLDEDAAALSVPSKTFNSFSVGNPILAIASPDSELKRLLEHYNCGVTFSSSQINEIADYIRTLEKNPQLYAQLADNSLKASLDFTEENAKELVK